MEKKLKKQFSMRFNKSLFNGIQMHFSPEMPFVRIYIWRLLAA
jgi:hypothetical protein